MAARKPDKFPFAQRRIHMSAWKLTHDEATRRGQPRHRPGRAGQTRTLVAESLRS
jgi:hypothetical protein